MESLKKRIAAIDAELKRCEKIEHDETRRSLKLIFLKERQSLTSQIGKSKSKIRF